MTTTAATPPLGLTTASPNPNRSAEPSKDPFLVGLGERIRSLRAARGMSRKSLAAGAEVSERYLANLETGIGNASVQLLRQVANALNVPLAVIVSESESGSESFGHLVQWLAQLSEEELQHARDVLRHSLKAGQAQVEKHGRIALIGLRGAGKSTLGRMLAEQLQCPFVELNREIEKETGASLSEIHSLYGQAAYRRYEQRALERVLREHEQMILATPGSLVSEPQTYELMLARCHTVWVRTSPEEHMARVMAQGDMRPMSGNREAMADLKRILLARTPLYDRADFNIDTSSQNITASFATLVAWVERLGVYPAARTQLSA